MYRSSVSVPTSAHFGQHRDSAGKMPANNFPHLHRHSRLHHKPHIFRPQILFSLPNPQKIRSAMDESTSIILLGFFPIVNHDIKKRQFSGAIGIILQRHLHRQHHGIFSLCANESAKTIVSAPIQPHQFILFLRRNPFIPNNSFRRFLHRQTHFLLNTVPRQHW